MIIDALKNDLSDQKIIFERSITCKATKLNAFEYFQ
ncbi:MAG: hypothetical protein ACI8VT_000643 [Saprospiraceae bacterium]|jgi:hypothetical protein